MFKNIFNFITTILVLSLFLFSQNSFAQVSGYGFTQTAGTYTEITGGTVWGTETNDDQNWNAINLGFTFNYDNVNYTQISLQTNGFLAMGATVLSSYTAISSGTSNNVVVGMNRDLQGQTGSELMTKTEGSSPNQIFIAQWKNYKRYGSTGTGDIYNFQIKLYETTNKIEFVYGTVTNNATATTVQVGLRGASNADFNNRTTTTNWAASNAGTTNADVMTLSTTVYPASGLTYTFTVPAILNPSGVSATTISTSQIDVAFTPYAGNNVIIVFNNTGVFTDPTGTPPSPGQPFAGGTLIYNGLVSPYNHTSLTPSTVYYYRLFTWGGGTTYSSGVSTSATTLCIAVIAPWIENFESGVFPPPCWSITPATPLLWNSSTGLAPGISGYGVGTASAWADFWGISATTPVDLISLDFDATGLINPTLKFDWAFDRYFTSTDQLQIHYSTDAGVTWVLLARGYPDSSGTGLFNLITVDNGITSEYGNTSNPVLATDWNTIGFGIPTGANKVKFTAVSDFGNNLFVDNIKVIQPLANDVGTVSIDVPSSIGAGTIAPQATVKNYGTNTNTFTVNMTITGGYSSTKTVTSLVPGATEQVTFDNWNATVGAYTINVCTQLGTDGDPSNDCKSKNVSVFSGSWASGSVYPTTTYLGSGVATNGFLYSIGGNTTSTLGTECYKYNVATDTWSPIASLPAGRRIHATAVVGNFVYAIGGSDMTSPGVYQSTVYKYDIALDSWTTVAPLPTVIGWGKAVGYNNNYIYFAGGYDGVANVLATVYLYNVTTNTWTAATSMPGPKFGGAFSVTGNTLVYAAGADQSVISSSVYVGTIDGTDPTLIVWTTMMNPYPGINKEVYSNYNGRITDLLIPERDRNNKEQFIGDATSYPPGTMYRFDGAPWGTDAIIVANGSPTASWTPANPNPCYVYKPATDTWIMQADVPIPVLGASLGTVNNGSTWKLVVASGLTLGSVVTDATQIYTDNLGGTTTFQLTVNVTNGWNMVSIPGLHPIDQNVSTWWAFRDPGANVFKYAGGYQAVATATPGLGYWMKHSGARTYNTGDEWPAGGIQIVPHAALAGATGWNLIGGYELSVTAANVTTNPPGLQSGPIYKYSGGYAVATTLDPGYGYWIKLTGVGQIIIPETLAKDGKPVEYFPENWGKIVLTDATGINYTLYAVKGKVDLSQYELPPAPMAGMFDIRFSSGRIAEDINSAIKTIEMSGVTYPLTVRVEGMDIRLMDESGKNVNVNLKAGEDVVISDASVMKLMVSGELIPAEYALEQNYPNPFNPSTVIEFSLPENVGNVKLSIYNTLGEKVAELVNTALTAGKYQYQWNAQNVATGMYIYELRTDKFVSVKKMLLLK